MKPAIPFRLVLAAGGFVAVVVAVLVLNRVLGTVPESREHLRLGVNRVELEQGSYELWWQTQIRPPDVPDPEDFEFELVSGSGQVVPIERPIFSAGLPGESEDLMRWKVAVFTVQSEDEEFVLTAAARTPVPPGELLLIAG